MPFVPIICMAKLFLGLWGTHFAYLAHNSEKLMLPILL